MGEFGEELHVRVKEETDEKIEQFIEDNPALENKSQVVRYSLKRELERQDEFGGM